MIGSKGLDTLNLFFIEVTLVYNIIQISCVWLYISTFVHHAAWAPPSPFPSGNHYSLLYISVCAFLWFDLFIYFVLLVCLLFIFHKSVKSRSICLSPSDISLTIIPSRSIHVAANGKISSFFMGRYVSKEYEITNSKIYMWGFLGAQWLRIRLPAQGTCIRALVREDPTCHGATKPMRHDYSACALEPMSHNYWARVPQLLKPMCLEPVLHNKRSHCNE